MILPEALAGRGTLCDKLTGRRFAVQGESVQIALSAGEGMVLSLKEGRQM